jgi:hypothetical protein
VIRRASDRIRIATQRLRDIRRVAGDGLVALCEGVAQLSGLPRGRRLLMKRWRAPRRSTSCLSAARLLLRGDPARGLSFCSRATHPHGRGITVLLKRWGAPFRFTAGVGAARRVDERACGNSCGTACVPADAADVLSALYVLSGLL